MTVTPDRDTARMDTDDFIEPGRKVDETGLIVYAWPPQGRFAELFERVRAITTPEERCELASLLRCEADEHATLVAYTDETGALQDVEPDWTIPDAWLRGQR